MPFFYGGGTSAGTGGTVLPWVFPTTNGSGTATLTTINTTSTSNTLTLTWVGVETTIDATANRAAPVMMQPRSSPPTPEQQARRAREADAFRARAQQLAEAEAQANARARELLISFLTPDEREEFEAHQTITFRAKSGKRYRIRRGVVGNIDVFKTNDTERVSHRLCVHPNPALPVFDIMLTQLLHLRHDETRTQKIANIHAAHAA